MTISVVIPAYNEEHYLPKTVESIHRLTRKPDEILVVDGGSTDRTAEVAKENGCRVITVMHRGIGYARQRGIEEASSDIIAFTDADTRVPTDWLTRIEETLSKTGTSCVFGSFRVLDGWWPYRLYINVLQPIINQMLWWIGVPMAAGQNLSFWKNLAIAAGGIPQDFKMMEDIELASRLKTVGTVVYDPRLIVISSGRRGHEGIQLILRASKAFFLYAVTHRADKVGFPDIR